MADRFDLQVRLCPKGMPTVDVVRTFWWQIPRIGEWIIEDLETPDEKRYQVTEVEWTGKGRQRRPWIIARQFGG
jgi:hypothetical protein